MSPLRCKLTAAQRKNGRICKMWDKFKRVVKAGKKNGKTIRKKRQKDLKRSTHQNISFFYSVYDEKEGFFGDFNDSSNVRLNSLLIPFIMSKNGSRFGGSTTDGQEQDDVHQSDTTVSFIQGRNWMWSLETGLLTAYAACLTSGAFTGQPQH